uniref:Uncharacterized protein n=1 Tax=Anopheles atroparvus TaxID=41427 RepID=A0A182J019_ANOAO
MTNFLASLVKEINRTTSELIRSSVAPVPALSTDNLDRILTELTPAFREVVRSPSKEAMLWVVDTIRANTSVGDTGEDWVATEQAVTEFSWDRVAQPVSSDARTLAFLTMEPAIIPVGPAIPTSVDLETRHSVDSQEDSSHLGAMPQEASFSSSNRSVRDHLAHSEGGRSTGHSLTNRAKRLRRSRRGRIREKAQITPAPMGQ